VQHPNENFADILARSGYIAVADAAWDWSRKSKHPFFSDASKAQYPEISD
jgi:hypothetical protein